MSDHPSTFKGDDTSGTGVEWDDRASLHEAGDDGGVLDGFSAIRRGSLAELVRFMMDLPADERRKFVIQKAGDERLSLAEVEELAERDDFPLK